MRIQHVEIYGFGKWQDKQFDFSDQNFIILIGENEAGKSTLRQFILFMLFGMPPRERKLYLPKKGGQLGGRLTLETDEGNVFTIERMHDRNKGEAVCYTADGLTKDENWLNKQLFGINKDTFLSIFSFDTTVLSRLHQMKQKDIGEVLLGVGMAGTDQIYWTEKWLEQQLNDYFKPQGKKPKINQLVETLAEKQVTLVQLEADASHYQEKQREIQKLKQHLTTFQEKQKVLHQEMQRIKQMIQQYDAITSYQTIKDELKLYPNTIQFPEQGLDRFDQLNRHLFPLQSETNMLQMKLEKEQEELNDINQSILTEAEKKKLNLTLEEIREWSQFNQALSNKKQEKLELERDITYAMNQLQLDLSLEDVQALSLPFATEERWIQLKEEQQELYQAITKLEYEQQVDNEQYEVLLTEQKKTDQQLMDPLELHQLKQEIEREEETIYQLEQSKSNQSKQNKWNKIKHQKKRTANIISIIGISLTVIIGLLALILEERIWFILSGVILVVVIFVRWSMFQSTKSIETFFESLPNHMQSRKLTDEELTERKQTLKQQEIFVEQQEKSTKQLKEMNAARLKLNEVKKFHLQRQQLVKQQINEQIEQFPFLEGITVEHWPKLYHYLETLLNQTKKYTNVTNQVDVLTQQLDDLEKNIKQIYQEKVAKKELTDTIPSIGERVRQVIDKDNVLVHKKDEVVENRKQLVNQLDELQAKMIPLQTKINTLWEHANVQDEESFLEKGRQKQAFDMLYKEYKTYENQLNLLLSEKDWMIINNGEKIIKSDLEARYEKMQYNMKESNEKMQHMQQQISDINAHIYQLETSQVLVDEKHHYYQLQNELQQQAKQWAIYQLAKNKINKTKLIYYNHYLPNVLSHTTTYFKKITSGSYLCVFIDEDSAELLVEDKMGFRYAIQELSQGTQDQLYISLRIGMSIVIKHQHNMPFFVDDAFVHFDSTRLHNMLIAFNELSKTSQVIWFTKEYVPPFWLESEGITIHKI
ncbi:AAA family ATPase [Paraliobacillus sp. JSM ZJ581]|uniref:ATP-binding protein n=1 Tax=Paraliobacillus sp. JSM ZJ581 TaxID=3342118 RepID=UPI0035A90902